MKAILFVILNVSMYVFQKGQLGGRTKKFSSLAIARHDPPPLQHTFNFYPGYKVM